ncbi:MULTISPECIES: type III secretion system stalk subunit SctO [Candidatus Ichthyocystis]|uniref:Putative Type III secretion protein YscO n=1 Tax=Candidatus Ichthyocystis hellenicum TaxID=1561003 RepID=A0A0S4M2V7_9BURK|nr:MULTISPECIES: YscO family type III secretion system apparatus protein [Ichthyocystis]CUT17066.1 putative Type III secretion protein YscO [Candidatus Ichthyocystis hellenicum]
MSVIDRLLKIKEFREKKAEIDLSNARAEVRNAEDKVAQAKKKWRDYQDFVIEEEKRLFSELYNKLVKRSDIEDVRSAVGDMQKKEIQYEDLFDEATDNLSKCKDVLKQKQKEHQTAMRVKQKFVELSDILKDEWEVEQNRKIDEEMDEIALSLSVRQESLEERAEEGAL